MLQLIVATKNPGKAREIADILSHLPLEVLYLQDFPQIPDIVEDGETFRDNACKKAETVLRHTGGIVLADDSGLEVDALGGEPGVHSARYAGEEASDSANNAKLLQNLAGVPAHKRTARFCCAIAIAAPGQETSIVEGYCRGIIAGGPRGDGGFGYDPLFLVPAYDKTFAELPPDVKNEISHRSRAMARAVMLLEKFL
jgi:XTP/dITP diphosphohydrolase